MRRRWLVTLALLLISAAAGCGDWPGRPTGPIAPRPDQVTNFQTLYAENCAACHGEKGQGGAAIALASPVYLAIASDDVLRDKIAKGVSGTPMAAFAQSAGGMLTPQQIDALVRGIRAWARPQALNGKQPPPYAADVTGNAERGADVYRTFCRSCHGAGGTGAKKAGSVVDPSFLALVSDQGLRTMVIAGRPEFDAPDWSGNVPGRPMTDQEVTDVVAWLTAHRIRYPGQPYPMSQAGAGKKGGQP